MKRLLFSTIFFLPLLLLAGSTAPKIVVPHSVYDAGEVMRGSLLQHDFLIKNSGTAVLLIKSAKPG